MVCSKRGGGLSGPFPVAARATDPLAAAAGNPKRSPLLRYGDTPTGGYIVTRLLKSGRGTRFPTVQFGANGVIVLEPVSGAAAAAEANGRFHFLIAGGRVSREGCLRPAAFGLQTIISGRCFRRFKAIPRFMQRLQSGKDCGAVATCLLTGCADIKTRSR